MTTAGDAKGEGRNKSLLGFLESIIDPQALTIEEDLGHGYVRLRVTEAERRQALQDIQCVEEVVKELVRNARDAGAENVFIAFQKERGRWRHITVIDDGCGIPEPLHRKIFEARVTSKVRGVVKDDFGVHGRGMALFSIKQVADEVRLVDSREGSGTIIKVKLDTEKVPERKDQSTFPRLERGEGGRLMVVGGPRNVPRLLTEFAVNHPRPRLYLGSNSEILCTLYHGSLGLRKRHAFGEGDPRRPPWFELGRLREGRRLHSYARERLGINISERNAFRILEREIPPLLSINELLEKRDPTLPSRSSDLHCPAKSTCRNHLARRLDQKDLELLRNQLSEIVSSIGGKYYLTAVVSDIRRRRNRLIITVDFTENEE